MLPSGFDGPGRTSRQAIHIQKRTEEMTGGLTLLIGPIPESDTAITVLDANTVVAGEVETMREAVAAWTSADTPAPGELALKARRLSQTYDVWFLALKPLLNAGMTTRAPAKYRDEFMEMIEEGQRRDTSGLPQ